MGKWFLYLFLFIYLFLFTLLYLLSRVMVKKGVGVKFID